MIVLVGGEKGGTGKTTLSTNFAAMRAAAGRDVLLIDTDLQSSASYWQAARAEAEIEPKVASVQKFGKGLAAEVRDLATRYQDIIIDAGGRDSVELRSALTVCEVAVLPIQPSQIDLWTVKRIHELLEQAAGFNPEIVAMAVVSRASTNSQNSDAQDALALISDYPGIDLAETIIRDRLSYRRAAGAGMSVAEYENNPESKGTWEMKKLYREVFEPVGREA